MNYGPILYRTGTNNPENLHEYFQVMQGLLNEDIDPSDKHYYIIVLLTEIVIRIEHDILDTELKNCDKKTKQKLECAINKIVSKNFRIPDRKWRQEKRNENVIGDYNTGVSHFVQLLKPTSILMHIMKFNKNGEKVPIKNPNPEPAICNVVNDDRTTKQIMDDLKIEQPSNPLPQLRLIKVAGHKSRIAYSDVDTELMPYLYATMEHNAILGCCECFNTPVPFGPHVVATIKGVKHFITIQFQCVDHSSGESLNIDACDTTLMGSILEHQRIDKRYMIGSIERMNQLMSMEHDKHMQVIITRLIQYRKAVQFKIRDLMAITDELSPVICDKCETLQIVRHYTKNRGPTPKLFICKVSTCSNHALQKPICLECQNDYHGSDNSCAQVCDEACQKIINDTTKPCPTCHTPIEKSEGCNHMTCARCRTEFCWICGIEYGRDQNGTYNMMEHYYDNEFGRIMGARCAQFS